MTEIDFEYERLVLVLNKMYYLSSQSIFKTFVANFNTNFLCVSVSLFLFACLCCLFIYLMQFVERISFLVVPDRVLGSV